jgi:beta-lactamase regulating signal transducer with metallopeptidase domain
MSDVTLLLVDWAAKSILIILLADLATRLMPGRAGLRRVVWIVAIASVLAVPIAAIGGPAPALIRVSRSAGSVAAPPIANWPEILWLVGVAAVAGAVGSGYVGLLFAMRMSEPWSEKLAGLPGTGFRFRGAVRRATNDSLRSPIAFGLFRPVVLLPKSSGRWTNSELRAVLIHELEHVRQLDAAAQILSQIAVTALWFNPFVWYAAAALRRECETNADEAVIRAGIRPSDYAALLLGFALAANRKSGSAVALSIVRNPNIEGRILAIVRPAPIPVRASRVAGLIAAIMGLCVVTASGGMRLVSSPTPTRSQYSADWQRGFEMGLAYKAAHPNENYDETARSDGERKRAIEHALQNRPPP